MGRLIVSLLNLAVVIGGAMVWARRGYKRRRAFWSRASWIKFGSTILVGLTLTGIGLWLSAIVGDHPPWMGAPGSDTRAAWALVVVGCMTAGASLIALTLGRFAQGDPSKPFSLLPPYGISHEDGPSENRSEWRVLATYASGFEADVALAQLEEADIPVMRDNNDTVGIFGPGFQGASARGITLRVPAEDLDAARGTVSLPGRTISSSPSDEP